MSNEWSLKELYESYESDKYVSDFSRLEKSFEELEAVALVDDLDIIHRVIALLEEQAVLRTKLDGFIGLQLTVNTTDEVSLSQQAKLSKLLAQKIKLKTPVFKFLGSITTDISKDEKLREYTFLFDNLKKEQAYLLSDEVEEVIATLNQSAGKSWEQLQGFLTSTVEVDFDGEQKTLSDIRNLAYSDSQDVRKRAFEAELSMYENIKEPVAFALNNIKSQVNDVSRLRGYDSPLDQTLKGSYMSKETLDALIGAIEDSLPAFHRYLKHKAKLLGHENGLPFYDLFAPIGESSSKVFTVEESRDYLVKHFAKFSKDLADLTATIYDQHHVDMFPKKGKIGGAFCWGVQPIKQSRILMNFDGSLRNVVTMAHELGHAYHNLHTQDHLPLNWEYSMPVAETASTFNEALIMNSIIGEVSDAEKISLIESELQDVTQIIVDIYSRYLFEKAVFQERQNSFLFSKDLEALMLDAQKKAYGDGLDHKQLHPFMWLCKGHYYSTGLSFYNYPYAFGGLFAKGLYAQYVKQPDGFVEKYQDMLRATTVSTAEDTAKRMGVDLTDKAFWLTALKQIEDNIDLFIRLTSNQ